MYMTSITVKFRPSSIIQKEGTLHYKIVPSLSICKYAILHQFPPFVPHTDKIITSYQLIIYIRTDGLRFTCID